MNYSDSGADYLRCCTPGLTFEQQVLETMLHSHSRGLEETHRALTASVLS